MVNVPGTGGFKFRDCLLKHYVRINGWLPRCKARKAALDRVRVNSKRRVRYFTFCASDAIDVLMLDIAKVVCPSSSGKFDNVVFFDRNSNEVAKTQKSLPGAIGFTGSFTDTVLAEALMPDDLDMLALPSDRVDSEKNRKEIRLLMQRKLFIREFPFDIINLDLEEFAFKPSDPFPGQIINALRSILQWQKRSLPGLSGSRRETLGGFTLMFTTQVGPPNITSEYIEMLRECLETNVREQPELLEILQGRFGAVDIGELERDQFGGFFRLAVPKILARTLLEADWYVDPEDGIMTFAFERDSKDGPYTILHFVMDVKLQQPPVQERAPNTGATDIAAQAYANVVRRLFEVPEVAVTQDLALSRELVPTLEHIAGRRRKYYKDAP